MRSLIRYGLGSFSDTFCSAVLMLLNMSILPFPVSFISVRNCPITSVISCLSCRWNVTISAVVTTILLLELLLLPRSFEGFRAFPPMMSRAPG